MVILFATRSHCWLKRAGPWWFEIGSMWLTEILRLKVLCAVFVGRVAASVKVTTDSRRGLSFSPWSANPKCRESGPLRLINGSNHPAQERVFTRHTCD